MASHLVWTVTSAAHQVYRKRKMKVVNRRVKPTGCLFFASLLQLRSAKLRSNRKINLVYVHSQQHKLILWVIHSKIYKANGKHIVLISDITDIGYTQSTLICWLKVSNFIAEKKSHFDLLESQIQ